MKNRFISLNDLQQAIDTKLENEMEMVKLGIISMNEYEITKEALESIKRRAFFCSSIIENLEIA